ncbi:sulfotransferase, partial [uncultured Thiohalocapsa sp.]|uniref:sulfotransferase n=1 Tax=uncultured Thiohalocapsa sp. TaxID=768990 RepID=UPI0025DAD784
MKIFCIGLSKTGTTSLTEALKILGYDAVHWYATKHAFRYTDDGGIDIDWDFFERHDAFADTPIARIYPQLDERYPDAKFILTLRDEDAWL